ncbi:recombinase family protein [Mucilaginibacter gracilis]|uniref:recombinase family protein n=1 Tax=Mucilaginibacter gracilis TaxID=423350 RepID=UPI000EB3ECCC|nr:recombinase family protein [Mucilaginibacter gracilis]
MTVADLYIRVSTDEQAEKGYSQRSQEEVLRKFCEIKYITVRHVYFEDHSAKTFKRPVWTKVLVNIRKSKTKSDLILFTKWDRFSRNAGDAYNMINVLRRFGVEPQAIEQPLDLTVPENKLMLAFYLAAPEVENDRRSLNVFNGQRKARKEGRWVSAAPLGYANLSYENGRKYIGPVEPAASAMKWVFTQIAQGMFTTEQVYREAVTNKGLKCGRNNLYTLIRNPVYCGKIKVPKHKDEEEYLADGLHEPLISEAIFYRVQDILDGRKQKPRVDSRKIAVGDHIPLRGFLICPECGKMLSGSSSKGRNGYYHYYHCFKGCPVRFKVGDVNTVFEKEFVEVLPKERYTKFYLDCILKAYKLKHKGEDDARKELVDQIREANSRITQARDLLVAGKFEEDDYLATKREAEQLIIRLEAQIPHVISSRKNIESDLSVLISNQKRAWDIWKGGKSAQIRMIIGACYTENMVFCDNGVRTTRINDINHNIRLINKELDVQKKWTTSDLMRLSTRVGATGFEPVTLCL